MIDVHISNGKLITTAHKKELEELLSKAVVDFEVELRSPCG